MPAPVGVGLGAGLGWGRPGRMEWPSCGGGAISANRLPPRRSWRSGGPGFGARPDLRAGGRGRARPFGNGSAGSNSLPKGRGTRSERPEQSLPYPGCSAWSIGSVWKAGRVWGRAGRPMPGPGLFGGAPAWFFHGVFVRRVAGPILRYSVFDVEAGRSLRLRPGPPSAGVSVS